MNHLGSSQAHHQWRGATSSIAFQGARDLLEESSQVEILGVVETNTQDQNSAIKADLLGTNTLWEVRILRAFSCFSG